MASRSLLDAYMEPLLNGDRVTCRDLVRSNVDSPQQALVMYYNVLWPAMEKVASLYRNDRINTAQEHMATRISRVIADQLQPLLAQMPRNGKRILFVCADDEPEELGAQMYADIFEARGWETFFAGGGVPADETLVLVGRLRPDILLIFGTQPTGVPGVRRLIDMIREVAANPTMNIMVSGGVFNRAAGLWEEVNADLFAPTAADAIPLAENAIPRQPEIRLPGAPKKRRRRRRPPLLATTA